MPPFSFIFVPLHHQLVVMSQQNIENDSCQDPWYVMWHMKPKMIETLLQKDSAGLFCKPGETPLPPYRFYVPFQYMPIIHEEESDKPNDKKYRPKDDPNALRSDLRNFVFIQASEERVRTIVSSGWNTQAHLRLNYYRDTNRQPVTISDAEVRMLVATIQNHHLQFYIDQPLADFTAGDKVVLQMEPWTGKQGVVKKVALKHGQLCMTISMNILGRTKSINFTDVRVGDVLFEDPEKGRMLTDNPITNYEEEIIDLLSHRFGNQYTPEVAAADSLRLRRLAAYDRIFVEDADEQARFTALKLICAYLLNNKSKCQKYTQEAQFLLTPQPSSISPQPSSISPQPSSISSHPSSISSQPSSLSLLLLALFIVTRDPQLRDAVKQYRNSHPDDCPSAIRRIFSIVKDLKTIKPAK